MNTVKKQQGFTIIEVVLVLAIAALIFLMIFVALPALQRGQRDTARKQDVGAIASAVNTYRSNTRGSLTGLNDDNIATYVDNLSQIELEDSSGSSLISVSATVPSSSPALDRAVVITGAKCDGNTPDTNASSRQAAVWTTLEQGGEYCQEA